jgi:uncharacterized protein
VLGVAASADTGHAGVRGDWITDCQTVRIPIWGKRVLNFISILSLLLFIVPSWGSSVEIPRLQGYVNDYGDMISPAVEAELTAKLKSFEASDSTQLVILTVPSLKGEPIEDYSIRVAEAWKIGHAGKDNGVLFTVSKEDRKMRVEVGRGLEGKLTDLTAGRIIDLVVKPKFKEGNFDAGFTAGISALIDATRGEFKADQRRPGKGRSRFHIHPFYFFIAWMLFITLVAVLRGRKSARAHRGRGWTSGYGGGWFPGGGGSGGGWSSGGDSGGGGDFGGGGASGDW